MRYLVGKPLWLAQQKINSTLFQLLFDYATFFQIKQRKRGPKPLKTIIWNVLSCDFDKATPPEQCYQIIAARLKPGDIVVFHDNDRAARNMRMHCLKYRKPSRSRGFSFIASLKNPEHVY